MRMRLVSAAPSHALDEYRIKWKLIAQLQRRVPKEAWRGFESYLGELTLEEVEQHVQWFRDRDHEQE